MSSDETITRLPGSEDGPRTPVPAQVVVVEGPSRGIVADVVGEQLTIGRRPDNDLVLASPAVSKAHARIVREGSRFAVEDLGSTNGLRINGVRLEPHGRRVLYHGDNVLVGDNLLLFRQTTGFTDAKTGMSTITFDAAKVRAEVDELIRGFPGLERPK